MEASGLIVLTALGAVLALPVAAHHMSPIEDLEIGDMMEMHDGAIEALEALDPGGTRNSDMGWDSADSPAQGETGAGVDDNYPVRDPDDSASSTGPFMNPQR
jgi:hypothetical protein